MGDDAGESFIKFPAERLQKYKNSHYRLVGEKKHSGVLVCGWTKKRIKNGKNCYKAVYGIRSRVWIC